MHVCVCCPYHSARHVMLKKLMQGRAVADDVNFHDLATRTKVRGGRVGCHELCLDVDHWY